MNYKWDGKNSSPAEDIMSFCEIIKNDGLPKIRRSGEIMKKYRPSNGAEGETFKTNFCYKCKFGCDDDCDIAEATWMYGIEDDEYPKEWIKDGNEPKCTAFKPITDEFKNRIIKEKVNCIYRSLYFLKDEYIQALNNKEKKQIINMLQEQSERFK
jgi:hypothetical protein